MGRTPRASARRRCGTPVLKSRVQARVRAGAARDAALSDFFRLLQQPAGEHVFNPWRDRDAGTDAAADAPAARIARLRAHLDADARWLLLGEAAGYQGAHVSGIPFTSERLMLEGAIPRIALGGRRLSTRPRPWSEPSATTVWGTLHALGRAQDTLLWNAFPWHPHRPGLPQTNRAPTPAERRAGLPVLLALLAAFPGVRCFAVGRNAETSLAEVGVAATPLRHPSMGGASRFRDGLHAALADDG